MGTLPAELTSFVGRRQELADTRALLSTGRLVTLTGAGGVGKTRLGLQVAAQVRRTFPDGVWLVELAAVQDAALLARTVSLAFGLRDADDDPAARLAGYLRDRSLLLVLDNCEHLARACAELVGLLLAAAPGIRVLATSRHVLGVDGEHVFSVPPLLVGEVSGLAPALELDVVRLFAERAAAVSPGFRVDERNWPGVVEVCRRLDGIPLAVELAAAWTRVLAVSDLLQRLDSFRLLARGNSTAPTRQQTLLATMDWSYDLCSEPEQLLWARLSVFVGGFDLVAAEAVCSGEKVDSLDVLPLLARLVDMSIVQADPEAGRFHLLEPIRQYGSAKLDGREIAVRHRDHYLRLAGRWSRDWRRGVAQIETYEQSRPEHANLRAALEFCFSTAGEEATGLRLVNALHFLWLFCGHTAEGRVWLERALELNPEQSRDRGETLGITAYALSLLGHAPMIYSYAREAEAVAHDFGDDDLAAHTVFLLGSYYFLTGDIEKSLPLFREALAGLPGGSFTLQVHSAIAQAEIWQGRPRDGLATARRGLELCDVTGEQYARSALLFASALSRWVLGEYSQASTDLTEGIRLAQTFNDVLGAVTWLELLCWTTAAMGQYERTAGLLGVASRLWPLGGGQPLLGSLMMIDAHETCERNTLNALGPDRYRTAFDRGVAAAVEFGQAISYAVGPVTTDGPPVTADPGLGSLSEREYQVAELVAEGLTNKEIALRLVISRRTAESHVVHILDKLGFSSRSQIATWMTARRHGGPG
ncbi:LuxR C-terminal-related transcriptional regulator [Kribbella sp. NPDC006257]|uniref:ATP-binding protein n=1 Tax=Kribbella sp. NPDC006257 TaxID=3156738 RepID=UPI0033A4FF08